MKKQQGSGLIFAVVLLFVILGMVITLSSVTLLETKMNQKTKSSVGAFYSSESGVEWALNQIATKDGSALISSLSTFSSGDAADCPFGDCKVYFLGSDGKVLAKTDTIDKVKAVRSVGTQGGETQRAIEAAVAATGEVGEYQLQCGTYGSQIACCRINTKTGVSECKMNDFYLIPTAPWKIVPNPFP